MDKKIRLYFTSDLHGYFFPTVYADRSERDMGLFKCANRFVKDADTLLIDGGDILQGSAFTSYCQSALKSSLPVAELMNRCGYDFVTLGNHDFNYGAEYLSSYLHALKARCVCGNFSTQDGHTPYPFQIRTMANGLKIGIAGVVTDYVTVWEKAENLRGVRIKDAFESAKAALDEMREKADITVCVYHGGFERDLNTGAVLTNTKENIACRICEELDFDILLTGHQHMSVPGRPINGTFALQSAENGKEFHLIEISVDEKGHKSIASQRVAAGGACDPALYGAFAPLENQVQKWLDETVGYMERELLPEDRIRMAAHGNGIADFLNHIQLYFSGAQVSAVSLANDVSGLNKAVTRRNILSTYPYPNSLVALEITGEMLRSAIERSAEYFTLENGCLRVSDTFLKPKVEHYNYDYYAGIAYQIDVTRPVGSRVVKLTREGKAVKDGDLLSVCVNNYRASGAGGYPMYPKCKVLREINTDMSDLILKYFKLHPHIGGAEINPGSFQIVKEEMPK
ncbi:MAG TPA: bifunctional UDP-sugar hydrolase/5'-nucleotidase [Clostridia bacterium]|nr:bifunctional UDP-sugar hydrolase/5'-nucleotidase [Clostridia bacterium]